MNNKIRILYIDDYELDRELVKDALEKEHGGFDLTEAANKKEFEALLKTRTFDVILSDFNIAGFEGLQVLEIVQAYDPRIPVIIVTGTGSEEIAVMALKQGASDYVIKRPKHIRRLPQTIFAAIEKQTLRDQREKAEHAQRESEKKYRAFYDNTPLPYQSLDEDGCLLDVNPAWLHTLGYERENVIGKRFGEFLHPDWKPHFEKNFPKFKECGHVHGIQFKIHHKVGHYLNISFEGCVGYRPDGKFKETYCVFHDITEKEQAEMALRESEQRFKKLSNLTFEGILLHHKGVTVDINDSLMEMVGYTREELIGKNLIAMCAPREYQETIREHIVKERAKPYEIKIKKKDGTLFPAEIESRDIKDGNLRVTAMRDITARKRAEDALRASEARYRSMTEAMTDPAYICSHDFRIEYMNSAMIEKIGCDCTGEICHKAFYDKDEQCSWCVFDQVLQGKNKTYERYDSETDRYYFINCSPVARSNAPVSKLSIFRNISEIKRLEKERIATEIKFQQAQKMESVGRLAGGVAHDYNNALSVIIGFTEMAIGDVDPNGPLRDDLGEVLKAANRATDITRQLLAFARKQTIAPKVLDLNEDVEGMLKMLRRLIGEHIDFVWLPGTNLWPVKMDPSQIDQILANLCVNARDAIEDVGKITIETGTVVFDTAYCADHIGFVPGEFVELDVSDNGCGMDKETLDKIFEPFFTTKDVDKGTGLGLATVYGIVKQNNGFTNVYSEPGKGTTIRIYLPRHEGKTDEWQVEITAEIPQGQGETILLVEDDLPILKLAQKILDGLGYTVVIANRPGKAVGLAEEHTGKIHLLVTDVIMPELNGRDLSERLKSLYPGLKCLFMSGYTADAIAEHGVLEEGINFIQKPFSKNDLARIVRKALDE